MDLSNVDKLPIEVREHIFSYVKDISLIPDGLGGNFWKKWFLKNNVKCIQFAGWEKSAKIMKDLAGLKVKRKPIALLNWDYMCVGTIADITIGKSFAKYTMKKDIIAAAGSSGLCMLVEPVNFESESHLDIWAQPSLMENGYTGEFIYTSYLNVDRMRKKKRQKCSPGVSVWSDNEYDTNKIFIETVIALYKTYNIDFAYGSGSDSESFCSYDMPPEAWQGFLNIYKEYGNPGELPILSNSLVFTKDPAIFEKPYNIRNIHKNNKICIVEDLNNHLIAFIVCIFTREDVERLLCNRKELCYYISSLGNIYFEKNNIYKPSL